MDKHVVREQTTNRRMIVTYGLLRQNNEKNELTVFALFITHAAIKAIPGHFHKPCTYLYSHTTFGVSDCLQFSRVMRKPKFWFPTRSNRPGCSVTEDSYPYKNEKIAAMLRLGCSYFAAIRYVCDNWWPQRSQLEWLVACLQQPCSFYQPLLAHRAASGSQLQLAAVT